MKDVFDIRYVKIHFTIQFSEDCELPKYKTSALRGGMGEMLLRANCVSDRDCEKCSFKKECIVQRIMYSEMAIPSKYATSGESMGYVIECEDYREQFKAGEKLLFNVILFGKNIVYFSIILNAFYALGQHGLGKDCAHYLIESVSGTKNEPILSGNNILMENYKICTIGEYVKYRRKQIGEKGMPDSVKFQSPTAIKFQGVDLSEFQVEAFMKSLRRRLYTLACFEGIETDVLEESVKEYPEALEEKHREVKVRRYSFHKKNAMYLTGIEGHLRLSEIPDEWLDLLLAGELVHIGKNTSFGFGRYRVY